MSDVPGAKYAAIIRQVLQDNEDDLRDIRLQLGNYSQAQLYYDPPNQPHYWSPILGDIRAVIMNLRLWEMDIARTYKLDEHDDNE